MGAAKAERVVVLGAGMAGLCVALALAPTGREIVLVDRDSPPPGGDPETAFDQWQRRGASQLRHSHAFLARLRQLLAVEHPDLLGALRAAGARELTFAQGLPGSLARTYVAQAGDEDMTMIVSRRSTLELVMRAYVERCANVTVRSTVFAHGLIVEPSSAGGLAARGFLLENGERLLGDIVIDAAGRGSPMLDWMAGAGLAVPDDVETCAILYYTRFFALKAGQGEPPRGVAPPNGDLGYLKFGVFPADAGTFSITLAVPEVETALRTAVVRPAAFEAICAALPGVSPWTDPLRSRAVSRVFAMGDLQSRWRDMAPGGRPLLVNAFSVGDSLVRTNPLFGRGCSFAAVEAHILRDVLAASADPVVRAREYAARVRRELRPFFNVMRVQDRAAARRAKALLNPGHRPSIQARLMRWVFEDGVGLAVRGDAELMRQAMRAFHMLAPPNAWLVRPSTLLKVIRVLLLSRAANARLRPIIAGPSRPEMFAALGLDARVFRSKAPSISLGDAER